MGTAALPPEVQPLTDGDLGISLDDAVSPCGPYGGAMKAALTSPSFKVTSPERIINPASVFRKGPKLVMAMKACFPSLAAIPEDKFKDAVTSMIEFLEAKAREKGIAYLKPLVNGCLGLSLDDAVAPFGPNAGAMKAALTSPSFKITSPEQIINPNCVFRKGLKLVLAMKASFPSLVAIPEDKFTDASANMIASLEAKAREKGFQYGG